MIDRAVAVVDVAVVDAVAAIVVVAAAVAVVDNSIVGFARVVATYCCYCSIQ